jgi:CRISPR system Cascade subunit CasD
MSYSYLLLWLEGPLQAWGTDSKFGRRDTLGFPSKSGVLGLVCAALGAGGEQHELLSQFAPLKQTVISFVRAKKNGDNVIDKCFREPLLCDFHMVGSGYNEDDIWQNLLIPKKSDGGKAVNGGAKLTYRYYLQDAYFAVVLEVPTAMSQSIENALQNPIWDLYLGRKNCVPTDFICRGLFENDLEAFDSASQIAHEKSLLEDFRVLDGEHQGETLVLNDVPLQFGEHKKYRDRIITVMPSV